MARDMVPVKQALSKVFLAAHDAPQGLRLRGNKALQVITVGEAHMIVKSQRLLIELVKLVDNCTHFA